MRRRAAVAGFTGVAGVSRLAGWAGLAGLAAGAWHGPEARAQEARTQEARTQEARGQEARTQEAPATTRTLPLAEVAERHRDAASRFAEVDGVRVHYKDEGRGAAVLLVHGTFGDLADWDTWAARLATRLRVLRLDLPGFGLTGPVASGNYSVDRLLGLVDGFMDTLEIERFAIAGVSFGGLVAFRYAGTRTERVSALLLANSAGIQPGQRAAGSGGYNILTDPQVREADVRRFLEFMLNDAALITPALVQRKLAFANVAGRGDEAAAALRLYERGTPERVLARVRAPALVMWGGANQALATQTADAFVAALRRAPVRERLIYADGGHMLHLQRAQQTADDAHTFFLNHLATHS